MRNRSEARASIAATFVMLGSVVLLLLPVALTNHIPDSHPTRDWWFAITLLAGCVLGGAIAASVFPDLGRSRIALTAAVAGALAIVGTQWSWSHRVLVADRDAMLLVAAIGAAAAGTGLGRVWPRSLACSVGAGVIQCAILVAGVIGMAGVQSQLGDYGPTLVIVAGLSLLLLGGAAAIRLIPTLGVGQVATSWLWLSVIAILLAMVLTSHPALVVLAAVVGAMFVLPFLVFLSSAGALFGRPRPAGEPLPTAQLVRDQLATMLITSSNCPSNSTPVK
jgi:hypothetical protein